MKGRQRATTGIYPTKESTKQTTKDQITEKNTTTHQDTHTTHSRYLH